MTTLGEWVEGARPRTLPAAIAPVLVGTGVAVEAGGAVWWSALLALVVALAVQVGVNYANDYSDGVRGTDDARVGPRRMVGGGLAEPSAVRAAALVALGVAAVAGLALAITTSWWLLLVGAVAIVAAWTYTGGPRPYGYRALGEVSVFVFFGLVAVVGTTYVQTERWIAAAVVGGTLIGALACAILVANNLRDIPTDRLAGKRTLAVALGDRRTRLLYVRAARARGRRNRRPRDHDDAVGGPRSRRAAARHRAGPRGARRCHRTGPRAGVARHRSHRARGRGPGHPWSCRSAELADRGDVVVVARAGPLTAGGFEDHEVVGAFWPVDLGIAQQLDHLVGDHNTRVLLETLLGKIARVFWPLVVVDVRVELDHPLPGDTANSEHKIGFSIWHDHAPPMVRIRSAVTISACRRSRSRDHVARADRTRSG